MKEFNDIEDLEQLLKPQCEFHASDTLKDEVIAKAKAEARPRKVRLLPWLAAACVAAIIGLFLMPPKQSEEKVRAKVESVKLKDKSVKNEAAKPEPYVAVADRKQQVKPSVCLNGVFTTRFNNRRLNKVVENAVRNRYKDIMLNTRIRENITLAESAGSGKSIFEYDANSNGAKDYKALTEEIMNR